ncbi:MAG: hypothetical protein ACXVPN_05115 [Bacteroidia bacterium]
MQDIAIYLLKGLGNLKFGATADEAEAVFGKPEETEELIDELMNEKSHAYHYWDKGFSLFFKDDAQKTFSCAEVDDSDILLFGKRIFELNEQQVTDLFKENGYKLSETEMHSWGEKRLSFDEAFADLYFEKGKLISINFCASDYPATEIKLNLN